MDDVTKQALSDILSKITDARADLDSVSVFLDQVGTDLSGLLDVQPIDPPSSMIVTGAALDSDTVDIEWAVVSGADGYLVGRDGTDRGGYGSWATTTTSITWLFENLKSSTPYTFSVGAYAGTKLLSTGSVTVTTPADPITPPATKGKLPVFGRSALSRSQGTNVVLFRSGVDDLAGLTSWESANGPVDGLMRFVPRKNEAEFLAPSFWDQMGQIAATGRTTVIALPWAPVSVGKTMNAQVAEGDWDAFHAKVAGLIVRYGMNRSNVVLRLAWEYNSTGGDGWYPWSTANGGVVTWRSAWVRTVTNFRKAGVTMPLWDQCANKGPQANNSTTGAQVFVDGMTDIVGIDHYAMYPAQTTSASVGQALNQVPGVLSQVNLSRYKGVQWSLDECGPVHPQDKDHGGDPQAYADGMITTIKMYKPAIWVIYDDGGAPATFDHTLARNPIWAKAVRTALKG